MASESRSWRLSHGQPQERDAETGGLTWPYLACYTLCFAVFALLFYAAFLVWNKAPIVIYDALDQHFTMFIYEGRWLREAVGQTLATGQLTIPLWDSSIGYGGDVIVTLAAYLGDPFNLLSGLIPETHAEAGFVFLQVLRLYLAGVAFSAFSLDHGNGPTGTLVGALTYAFAGWSYLVASQVFFINPCILLPLMLLGADRVLRHESPVLLMVSTALMFAAYVYFAYMACLILLVYCLVMTIDARELARSTAAERLRFLRGECLDALRVLGSVVVGAGMAAWTVIPVVMTLLGQGRLGISHPVPALYSLRYYARILVGFVDYFGLGADAYVGCGGLCVLSAVLLLSRKGNGKLKLCFAIGTAALLIPAAGWVMNGMSYVANRWAFAYFLCVGMINARMLPALLAPLRREVWCMLAVTVGIGVVALAYPETREINAVVSLLPLCFLILMAWYWTKKPVNDTARKGAVIALIAATSLTIAVPAYHYFSGIKNLQVDRGTAYDLVVGDTVSSVVKEVGGDGFYRYDSAGVSQRNNGSALTGAHGYDFYISLYNGNIERFEKALELDRVVVAHQTSGPYRCSYLEAALGTKYFVVPQGAKRLLPYGFSRTPLSTATLGNGQEVSIHESRLALPLAYVVPDVISLEDYEALTAIEKRQALLQAVGLDGAATMRASDLELLDVTIPYEVVSSKNGARIEGNKITVPCDGASLKLRFEGLPNAETMIEFSNLRMILTEPNLLEKANLMGEYGITLRASNGGSGKLRGRPVESNLYGGRESSVVTLGWSVKAPTSVTLTFNKAGSYSFEAIRVAVQPTDQLTSYVDALRATPVTVQEQVNAYVFSGTFEEGACLYATVPWSSGWSATIDGVPAQIEKANDAFMALRMPAGTHEVRLTYVTPGLALGGGVALASLLVMLVTVGLRRSRRKRSAVDR